ncbi:MAG: hypothetical protein V3T96_03610 [Thermodesulfobacteriota bacterium]|jgi:hypothetical protein
MNSNDNFPEPEWTVEEWTEAWTIRVGKAYACLVCGNMVMVTKGGVGVMEPRCCDKEMEEVERPV